MKNMYEFLFNIVKLDYQSLNSLIVVKLKDYYDSSLITHYDDNENSFIYVEGSQPYMLVAHTDTVHKQPVKEILITKSFLDVHTSIISSPQGIGGDDRNGIALIFALLDSGHRPSILFPSGEEIGGLGSKRFTELMPTLPNVNFIIQFDRRNNLDVTRYADDNDALIKEIVKLGYTEVNGSFSDISIICPKYSISGVNISASFFNEHTLTEYTDLRGLVNTFNQLDKFLQTDVINNNFVYKPKTYVTSGYEQTSLFDWDGNTLSNYNPKNPIQVKASKEVFNYSTNSCYECGLYGGSLHPIADVGGDVVICDKCVQTLEHSFICPFCNEVNTLDIASEFAFDIHRLEASITCVGCVEQVSLDGLFNKNTIDVMISILMDSIKTKGEF